MAVFQTTFRYFKNEEKNGLEDDEQSGCTILPQAYSFTLIFDEKGYVDFRDPQCIHCGGKLLRRNGHVFKYIINSSRDYKFTCFNYSCKICGRNSSPILSNAFVYDAALEGMKRINQLIQILDGWEKKEIDEKNLTRQIYSFVNKIYSENINLPRGKNTIISDNDLKDLILLNIIDGQCSEMSSNLLNLPGKLRKSASADTVMMYLGRNTVTDIRKDIRNLFDVVNEKASKMNLYDNPVPIAIDFHLEPYYGKCNNKTIKIDKRVSHAGTLYNFKYATADIALEDARLTVYGQHISPLDLKKDIFQEVVDYCQDKLIIDYVMADREFFTVPIIQYLIDQNLYYIIPAIKNKLIMKIAKNNYDNGIYFFTYPFGQEDGVNINIIITRNEKYDVSKLPSSDNPEFFVFSTNLPINHADTTAENIKHCDPKKFTGFTRSEISDMYSKRWGIETDYRIYAQEFRPRTTSNKFSIRYFNFFSGEIMRNIWVLSKILFKDKYEKILSGKILRARLFKELLREGMEENNKARIFQGLRSNLTHALGFLSLPLPGYNFLKNGF